MGACLFPFHVENKRPFSDRERYIPVPCGKCPECLKRRASTWSFRLKKEAELASSALFVTLTYDTAFVPITKRGFMTLDKDHVKKFTHQLRNFHRDRSMPPLRYYICGEYGTQKQRPHYHAIIFNSFVEAILDRWPYGSVHIGSVTDASIGYTVVYMNKGKVIPMHKNDDRIPEFHMMSKGLGRNYITEQTVKFHWQSPEHQFITLPDGFKISLPRYFKDKIFPKDDLDSDIMRLRQAHFMKNKIRELEAKNTMTEEEKYASKLNAIQTFRDRMKNKRK